MIVRLSVAYGAVHAVLASAVVVLAGIVVGQNVVGVTRQPLPLTWPLAVLLVVAAQLPLREILGPAERVAARAVLTRGVRAGFTLLIIAIATAANALTHAGAALQVFLLLLVAVGFVATALARTDSWVWTLGLGMGWVGLQFVTPMGQPMASFLEFVGGVVAGVLAVVSAALYAMAATTAKLARVG